MDKENFFHTRTTYNLERVDYFVALTIMMILFVTHLRDIRWGPFLAAFAWIDLVGYIPGAIYYRRAARERRRLPVLFPILYNLTHSMLTNAVVVLAWAASSGGFEWAMLAAPIHLLGDRGIFGNIYKPLGLSFEPVRHPLFERFAADFQGAGRR
jgi:hypothetical protein